MSKEVNSDQENTNQQLSWGSRSFIAAPSSTVLLVCISVIIGAIILSITISFFITVDLTVKSKGVTDSLNGIKETVALTAGQIYDLSAKEGSFVKEQQILGHIRMEGTNEEKLQELLAEIKKHITNCQLTDCKDNPEIFEFVSVDDQALKDMISTTKRKFADYLYAYKDMKNKMESEVEPLRSRLRVIEGKLTYLKTSSVRNYLLMQKESLEEEKGRIEQQLTATENNLSNRIRESKEDAVLAAIQTVAKIESFITRHQLRAPVTGKITRIRKNQGSFVSQYEPILSIIPETSPVVVRAQIRTMDVALVEPGNKVFLNIDAYPAHKYGNFEGRILEVEKIASTSDQGEVSNHYVAKVSIDLKSLKKRSLLYNGKPLQIKITPGMNAEVRIVTGTDTLMSIVLNKVFGGPK